MNLNVKLDDGAIMPTKAHEWDAGFDLYTPVDCMVLPHRSIIIDTGVHVELPEGYCGVLEPKSGLNVKHGLIGHGVIDAGYTGSVMVKLYNLSDDTYTFASGDKIIQMLIEVVPRISLVQVDEIKGGERQNNGFGSSDR